MADCGHLHVVNLRFLAANLNLQQLRLTDEVPTNDLLCVLAFLTPQRLCYCCTLFQSIYQINRTEDLIYKQIKNRFEFSNRKELWKWRMFVL